MGVRFNEEENLEEHPVTSDVNKLEVPERSTFALRHSSSVRVGARQKVVLAPKHSPMGWEKLKKSKDMRGISPHDFPLKLTKDELAKHNTFEDAWISLDSKIYNVTDYLNYHPGGEKILKPFLGKEAAVIFRKYHRWVNYERILDDCFLGFLQT